MRSDSPRVRRRHGLTAIAAAVLAAGVLATPVASGAGLQAQAKLDNPYAGAKAYVNPEWSKQAAAEPGGSKVSNQPTGVWLDRIAAINGANGSMGLRAHLDAALAQGANLVQLVVYDLPGRDCAALASNGELGPNDLPRY